MHRDLPYSPSSSSPDASSEKRLLDLFTAPALRDAPCVLFVHGGNWISGDKRIGGQMADTFVAAGFVFVAITGS